MVDDWNVKILADKLHKYKCRFNHTDVVVECIVTNITTKGVEITRSAPEFFHFFNPEACVAISYRLMREVE